MNRFLSLILFFALTSCTKKEVPFDVFVYSFSAYPTDFSIKITQSDTIYMQKRNNFERSNFYALLNDTDRDSLIALTEKVDFLKYKNVNETPGAKDGVAVKFYRTKKGMKEWAYGFSGSESEELFPLAMRFNKFAKGFQFVPTDEKVDFGDLKYIELPTPPPISIKNPTQ